LRQYGLIPSIGEAAGRTAAASHEHSGASLPRQIIDIQDYETWKDVIDHPREFMQTLYSAERVDWLLGRRTLEQPAYSAAN
jgi:hypothetical protein